MRIIVNKEVDGVNEVTIVPHRRSMLPPIVVRGRDRAAVIAEVATTIAQVRPPPKVDPVAAGRG